VCVQVLGSVLGRLCSYSVLYHASPERMSKYQLLQARDKFRASGPPEGIMVSSIHTSTIAEFVYT